MLRKNKYSFVQKKWAVKQYLNGNMSAVEIAKRLNMPKTERNQILAWVHQYQSNQVAFLSHARHNNHYSKELKERGVKGVFKNI